MPRTLSTDGMIAAIAATPAARDAASEALADISPLISPKLLERLTAEGFIQAFIIMQGEKPVYCIWCHKTLDGGFHLNAAVQLTAPGAGMDILSAAVESLAKKDGCSFVRFNTSRAGLIRQAVARGYQAQSITLTKAL